MHQVFEIYEGVLKYCAKDNYWEETESFITDSSGSRTNFGGWSNILLFIRWTFSNWGFLDLSETISQVAYLSSCLSKDKFYFPNLKHLVLYNFAHFWRTDLLYCWWYVRIIYMLLNVLWIIWYYTCKYHKEHFLV